MKKSDQPKGFKPSELLLDYTEFKKLSAERKPHLRATTKRWLFTWEMWDFACSPMDDSNRSQIRYGHYLGWHEPRNPFVDRLKIHFGNPQSKKLKK